MAAPASSESYQQPVVFFGTDEFSAIGLEKLISLTKTKKNIKVVAIITKPDAKKGRGKILEPPVTKVIGQKNEIPVYQPATKDDLLNTALDITNNLETAPLGVLISYGKIVPQAVIDLFKPGIINLHPSLLPLYRGPSPVETAIANGDAKTGVSIMQLSAKMDAGPVYIQKEVELTGQETGPSLLKDLGEIGANLIATNIDDIINGNISPIAQQEGLSTYCHLLSKDQSIVDPAELTAQQIDNHVRAFIDFPKTKLSIEGYLVVIKSVQVIANDSEIKKSDLIIDCAVNTKLKITQLISPNGKQVSGDSFKNGYLKV